MIIIGEKLNSILKKDVFAAISKNNGAFLQDLAKNQYEAGATFIDINAEAFLENEPEKLEWLVNILQEAVDAPFSIDSSNPAAIERALKVNRNKKPIINSITGEKRRLNQILPLVTGYDTGVIVLCMDDSGMPETIDERISLAEKLVRKLTKSGIKPQDIYIDPMVRPIGSNSNNGSIAIESIRRIRQEFPETHMACGISNISFGIPARRVMNQAFLVAAVAAGLDGAILDPLDKKLMALIYAAEALIGKDAFCMEYHMKYREGLLDI